MSGFEVAGLALAILPVLMSCAKQYNSCLRCFGRYKSFTKEARNYTKDIEIQRTIFRNECRNLLEEVVDHDAAASMLNMLDQEAWASKKLDEQLVQMLGESLQACITIIGRIEEQLQDLSKESKGFTSIIEQEKKTTPKNIRDKLWKRNMGEKLHFSFSKPKLDDNIAKLRSHNDDFRVLALQTRRTLPTSACAMSKPIRRARTDIRKYQMIGKASCQVYEALRKACTKHSEHVAHFRMEEKNVIGDKEASPQVQFDIAFSHRTTFDSGEPIWLLVDSIINEHAGNCTNVQAACMAELAGSLKRQLKSGIAPVTKRMKKSVRFAPAESPQPSPCPLVAAPPTLLTDPVGIDFCDYLRRHFRQPQLGNACVVLQETVECKQLVYPSHITMSSGSQKPTSLQQIIRFATTPDLLGGILLPERIALAKILAVAVLQYHATPWLRRSWRSEDILFFTANEDTQKERRPDLEMPYINTKIQGQSTKIPVQRQSTMARSPILFSLGVVLLELAHGASLDSLTLPCDADNGQMHREFFAARRLAKSKRTVMGARYNDIVEQLIECVFPCSGDLTNPELQHTYYEDVICPLEELEENFRKLYLDEHNG